MKAWSFMLLKQTFIESKAYSTQPVHIWYYAQKIPFYFLIEFVNNSSQFCLSSSKTRA